MKRIVLIGFILLFSCVLHAQDVQQQENLTHSVLVDQLSQPNGDGGARIKVVPFCNVILEKGSLQEKLKGYRVRIYFDNSQQARIEAEAVITKFKKIYPQVPAFLNYTIPYFKVTVGNFLTKEEAVKLWGSVLHIFPTSFIVSETISLDSFLDQTVTETYQEEENALTEDAAVDNADTKELETEEIEFDQQ